jgi:predicted metalloendopeptidase
LDEPGDQTQGFEKLAHLNVKIAYPDKWRDYAALTCGPTTSRYAPAQIRLAAAVSRLNSRLIATNVT